MHTQNNIEQCWRRCLRLRANKSSCGILCVPLLFFHQSGLRNSTEIYKLMFPHDETASQLVAYSPQPSKPTKSHCCRQGKRRFVPNMKHRMQNTNTNSTPEQTLKRFSKKILCDEQASQLVAYSPPQQKASTEAFCSWQWTGKRWCMHKIINTKYQYNTLWLKIDSITQSNTQLFILHYLFLFLSYKVLPEILHNKYSNMAHLPCYQLPENFSILR